MIYHVLKKVNCFVEAASPFRHYSGPNEAQAPKVKVVLYGSIIVYD